MFASKLDRGEPAELSVSGFGDAQIGLDSVSEFCEAYGELRLERGDGMDLEDDTANGTNPPPKRERLGCTVTIAQLEAFLALTLHGGLQRAAKKLSISETALRDRIHKLEEWIGLDLFEKRPTYRLTAAGHQFRRSAEFIVIELYDARVNLKTPQRLMIAETFRELGIRDGVNGPFRNTVTGEEHFEID